MRRACVTATLVLTLIGVCPAVPKADLSTRPRQDDLHLVRPLPPPGAARMVWVPWLHRYVPGPAFAPFAAAGGQPPACTVTISNGTSLLTTLTNVASGGTVCLNAGSYGLNASISKASRTTIRANDGVAQANVTITGVNLGTSQNLTFYNVRMGTSGDVSMGGTTTAQHIILDTILFVSPLEIDQGQNINADILVTNSKFPNLGPAAGEGRLSINGMRDEGGQNHTNAIGIRVSFNEFGPGGCGDGVQTRDGANGVIVEYNEFHGIHESGCEPAHTDPLQPFDANNVQIRGNYFHDNTTGIMSPDCSTGLQIEQNVMTTDGEYPDQMVLAGVNNTTFLKHNTLLGAARVRFGSINSCSLANGVLLQNNIIQGGLSLTEGQTTSSFTMDHNNGIGGTNPINGSVTFMGGASPSTWAGFQLTALSIGHNAGSDGMDIGTNYYGVAAPPATAPDLVITTPSAGTAETTAATFTTMAGTCTASSGRTISSVTWSNASGGSGTATGTTSWSIASISLTVDTANVVTVTCTDNTTEASQAAVSILRVSVPGAPSDAFTRGTWATLGPNWTEQTSTLLTTTSSQAFANIAGTRQCAFWSAHGFSNDQFSQIKITNLPTSGRFHYAAVRAAQTGDAAYDNYEVIADSTVGGAVIAKVINGTQTQLQTIGGITWALNDTLRLEITGDTLKAFRNGVQIGNNQAAGGQLTSGSAGICGYGGASLDDFTGGALSSDTTAPVVTIVSPTGNATYSVVSPALTSLSGTATDAVGVTSCTCTNSRGGSCTVTGTSAWSIGSVTMQLGSNVLTVSCLDLAVNVGSAQVTVTYAPVFTLFR